MYPITFLFSIYMEIKTFDFDIFKHIQHTFPYIIIGVFALFLATIFKQGFTIQQENDLTI